MGELLDRRRARAPHRLEHQRLLQDGRGQGILHGKRPRRVDWRGDLRHGAPSAARMRERPTASTTSSRAPRPTASHSSGVQGPLRLDALNEPQPDVVLLKPREDYYQDRHPGAANVLLLVELSESWLRLRPRDQACALRKQFGVPEVWIVDLRGAAIEVYREPAGGAYALKQRLTSGSLAPSPTSPASRSTSARSSRDHPPRRPRRSYVTRG